MLIILIYHWFLFTSPSTASSLQQLPVQKAIESSASSCQSGLENVYKIESIIICERFASAESCSNAKQILSAGVAASVTGYSIKPPDSWLTKQSENYKQIKAKLIDELQHQYHENWRQAYQDQGAKMTVDADGVQVTRAQKESLKLAKIGNVITKASFTGAPNVLFSSITGKHINVAAYTLKELEEMGASDLVNRTRMGAEKVVDLVIERIRKGNFDPADDKAIAEIAKQNHNSGYDRIVQYGTQVEVKFAKKWDMLDPEQRVYAINQIKPLINGFKKAPQRWANISVLAKDFALVHAASGISSEVSTKARIASAKGIATRTVFGVGSIYADLIFGSDTVACSEAGSDYINLDSSCKPIIENDGRVLDFLALPVNEKEKLLKIPAVCDFYNKLAIKKMKNFDERLKFLGNNLTCQSGNLVHPGSGTVFEFESNSIKKIYKPMGEGIQHIYHLDREPIARSVKKNSFESPPLPLDEVSMSVKLFGDSVKMFQSYPAAASLYKQVCGSTASVTGSSVNSPKLPVATPRATD